MARNIERSVLRRHVRQLLLSMINVRMERPGGSGRYEGRTTVPSRRDPRRSGGRLLQDPRNARSRSSEKERNAFFALFEQLPEAGEKAKT